MKYLVGGIGVVLLMVSISAAFGCMFWLLWGGVVVPVFKAPELSFMQSWGLSCLLALVGSFFKESSSK